MFHSHGSTQYTTSRFPSAGNTFVESKAAELAGSTPSHFLVLESQDMSVQKLV